MTNRNKGARISKQSPGVAKSSKINSPNARNYSIVTTFTASFDFSTEGTFSRPSDATWFSQSALAPRILDYSGDELREPFEGWIALEGSGTNLNTESTDATTYLDSNVTITPNSDSSFGFGKEADVISPDAAGGFIRILSWEQSFNAKYCASWWMGFQVGNIEVTSSITDEGVNTTSEIKQITTDVFMEQYFLTASLMDEGAAAEYLQIESSAPDENYSIYGIQVEKQDFPTSFIPTEGTIATRSADMLTFDALPSWAIDYSFKIKIRPSLGVGDFINGRHQTIMSFSGTDSRLYLAGDGTDVSVVAVDDSFNISLKQNIVFDKDQEISITFNPKSKTMNIEGATSGNGLSTVTSTDLNFPIADTPFRLGAMWDGDREYYGLVYKVLEEPS